MIAAIRTYRAFTSNRLIFLLSTKSEQAVLTVPTALFPLPDKCLRAVSMFVSLLFDLSFTLGLHSEEWVDSWFWEILLKFSRATCFFLRFIFNRNSTLFYITGKNKKYFTERMEEKKLYHGVNIIELAKKYRHLQYFKMFFNERNCFYLILRCMPLGSISNDPNLFCFPVCQLNNRNALGSVSLVETAISYDSSKS